MAGKYLTLSATGVVLGLTGSICIWVAFLNSNWLNVLETVDVEAEEKDNTNLQETAESPGAGSYGQGSNLILSRLFTFSVSSVRYNWNLS